MASLFHPGVAYILNDAPRPNCAAMATEAAWAFVFGRCVWDDAVVTHVREVQPGYLTYHLKVVVRGRRATDGAREGHFGDCAVVDERGRCMLLQRSADAAFFAWYDGLLKPDRT
uniref:Uncharacterized protein n=1 Tax=Neobodo designis TaxID=312471 RepID=A0A7S1M0S2_NEODS|mmetsp:Transcript_30592/g.94512  ORF Transcript_30592/g.94512 Transcript_30592/m.94512 type:complete len:114 (+) Transcript_30592:434-775(+)